MENVITIRVDFPGLLEALTALKPQAISVFPVIPAQPPLPQTPAADPFTPPFAAVPLAPQPAAPAALIPPAPAPVPTAATPTYTLEQLAVAATPLIDGGRRQELVSLLAQFGVRAMTQLQKEQYGAFATALRGLGSQI